MSIPLFSIIIPTWNNLDFVKLCVQSITKNSAVNHEIILHINDGQDGTLEWAKAQNIKHTHSQTNIGICHAVNIAAALATQNYIVYMNDDMYACPQWDTHLAQAIHQVGHNLFMLSGTMIEPQNHNNPCVYVQDYGSTTQNFKETELLANYKNLHINDWNGSAWPPTLVHKEWWHKVGGFSTEFSPGMSSDDDFAMKFWYAGCRWFQGVGASKIYHFQSKSTHRIVKNNGRKQFLGKWFINQSTLNKHLIKRGTAFTAPLPEPTGTVWRLEKLRAKFKLLSV